MTSAHKREEDARIVVLRTEGTTAAGRYTDVCSHLSRYFFFLVLSFAASALMGQDVEKCQHIGSKSN